MSTFTPTTEGVRNSYIYSAELHDGSLAAPKEVLGAEFDRWLAAHDAETAAKALEDAAEIMRDTLRTRTLGMPTDDWLRARAAAIRTQQEGTE